MPEKIFVFQKNRVIFFIFRSFLKYRVVLKNIGLSKNFQTKIPQKSKNLANFLRNFILFNFFLDFLRK